MSQAGEEPDTIEEVYESYLIIEGLSFVTSAATRKDF
jgi:Holliday junction resolvasome RuvABC ATP-dependent DNA helicase subunit